MNGRTEDEEEPVYRRADHRDLEAARGKDKDGGPMPNVIMAICGYEISPCGNRYLVMAFVQLTYRESLRHIETCLGSLQSKLYHLGFRGKVARSMLVDANESRDWRFSRPRPQTDCDPARAECLFAMESFTKSGPCWFETGVIWSDDQTNFFQAPDFTSGSTPCKPNGMLFRTARGRSCPRRVGIARAV